MDHSTNPAWILAASQKQRHMMKLPFTGWQARPTRPISSPKKITMLHIIVVAYKT